MLDAYLYSKNDQIVINEELSDTAFWESHQWGVWALIRISHVHGGRGAAGMMRTLSSQIENGAPLKQAIEVTLDVDGDRADSNVVIVLSRFESFHYEVCVYGEGSACLVDTEGGAVSLITETKSGSRSTRIARILGDIHEGECLLLSTQQLNANVISREGYEYDSANILAEHVIAAHQANSPVQSNTLLAVRYVYDKIETSRSDFDQSKTIGRNRHAFDVASKPLMLTLILSAVATLLLAI